MGGFLVEKDGLWTSGCSHSVESFLDFERDVGILRGGRSVPG